MTGCRIGKVRCKRTGRELHVLYAEDRRKRRSDRFERFLKEDMKTLTKAYAGELDGYALVVWDTNGRWAAEVHVGGTARQPSVNTLPEWVAGALRRRVCEGDIERMMTVTEPGEPA